MLAGDSEIQEEVCLDFAEDIRSLASLMPGDGQIRARKVAELYARRRNEAQNRRAEQFVLAPLGLTLADFHALQGTYSPGFVEKVATELFNFEGPETEAIIAGIDETGPHIFVCKNSEISCRDGVGFAAIGAGAWHAESQLMFAGHTPGAPLAEALLNLYFAKKRAEVAPGVGSVTDMVFVPTMVDTIIVGDHIHSKLKEVYEAHLTRLAENNNAAKYEMGRYVDELLNPKETASPAQLTLPEASDVHASTGKEEVRKQKTQKKGTRSKPLTSQT